MTKAELIKFLEQFDDDTQIIVKEKHPGYLEGKYFVITRPVLGLTYWHGYCFLKTEQGLSVSIPKGDW